MLSVLFRCMLNVIIITFIFIKNMDCDSTIIRYKIISQNHHSDERPKLFTSAL